MIIMKLNGGLGNQMFQYAYGRALQEKFRDELYLDIEEFRRTYGNEPRHYSLDNFLINENVKILPNAKSKKLISLKVLQKINPNFTTRIAEMFGIYWWRNSTYKEFLIANTINRKSYFYGYWQSERYFKEISETIKKEFVVKKPVLEESRLYINEINELDSVCVHIRRGDYIAQGMICPGENYYLNGMDIIRCSHPKCSFFVFSDDLKWVKENINFKYSVTYVNIKNPDYEVLRLMYMCNHFVIANSSFSWWAQYLSERENKMVVAPKQWYPSDKKYDNSIYQSQWIVI